MKHYERALALLEKAADIMDAVGDTLAAAHIATPIDVLKVKLAVLRDAGSGPKIEGQ